MSLGPSLLPEDEINTEYFCQETKKEGEKESTYIHEHLAMRVALILEFPMFLL